MKTIYNLSIYSSLLILAACAADETSELESPAIDYDIPRIVVFGGSATSGLTRADDNTFPEPSNYGTCNADKIRILQFRVSMNNVISASDLKPYTGSQSWNYNSQLDSDLENQLNYRDKWATSSLTLKLEKGKYVGFAFPAIAYNNDDADSFTLSTNTYSALSIKLQNAEFTPELYFGRLKPIDIKKNNIIQYDKFDKEGFVYRYSYDTLVDCQLEGSLYRIVSQLNVNINDINPNVTNLEMILSNVPIRIGLYEKHRSTVGASGQDHGFYYPVKAASDATVYTDHHCMKPTTVSSVSVFKDGNARLSTFLLPSDIGRTVTIKATLNKAYFDAEKNTTQYKDTVISRILRAGKDYNLDLPTSKVYFSNTALPVYKEATSEFMSYSNVRVNVSGRFSDIFSN